jgi:hypothetical protein
MVTGAPIDGVTSPVAAFSATSCRSVQFTPSADDQTFNATVCAVETLIFPIA